MVRKNILLNCLLIGSFTPLLPACSGSEPCDPASTCPTSSSCGEAGGTASGGSGQGGTSSGGNSQGGSTALGGAGGQGGVGGQGGGSLAAVPGIEVSAISGPSTEAGGQATFSVVLQTQPSAAVTVNFNSDDSTEGTVSPTSLTFTDTNWNAPQSATVTGEDDDIADGHQAYQVVFTATASTDTAYATITPAPVAITNVDDETAGISVSPVSGPTTEAGGQATFTVALNSEPTANVMVHFDSDDTSEGTVGSTSLMFTTVNWSAPQPVTLTGQNDDLADGYQTYQVVFSQTTSTDTAYAGITPAPVLATNVDDETAGITVSPLSGPTTEAGGQATFTVVLNSEPAANVTVNFDSNAPAEGTLNHTSLTFTDVNWSAPQPVTLTGEDDDLADGNQPYQIVFTATASTDSAYAAITPAPLPATNMDDETAGITVSAPSGPTTEASGQATFTVVLNSEPSANVTVNFDSDDGSEGIVAPTALTFTPTDWSTPKPATLTGVDDELADGNQLYTISFPSVVSNDPVYAAMTPATLSVTNVDDDTADIVVSAIRGPSSEGGGQATFTVVLTSRPFVAVTVNLDSGDSSEGTIDKTALDFTTTNWMTAQTVTVTGADDGLVDGNQPYAIVFSAPTTSDPDYATITPNNVTVTNLDDEPPLELDIDTHDALYTDVAGTRGFHFTAPVSFTIIGLRVPTDVNPGGQNIEVVRFNSPVPTWSTTTNDFTSLAYFTDVASDGFITTHIPIQAGDIIGILGARGDTTMRNSYGATNTYNTTISGQAVTLYRLIFQDNLNTTQAYDLANDTLSYYGRVEMQYVE